MEIYSTDFFKIKEDKTRSLFTIEFPFSSKVLINSLIKTRLIQGAMYTEDYKEVTFKAQSVQSLLSFKGSSGLSINIASEILKSLTKQLEYLIRIESHTILGFSPENIIVINNTNFIYLASDYIIEIKDDFILLSFPFNTSDFFISLELLKINQLPSYVHYKTSYFSLACLITYALTNNTFYEDYLITQQIDTIIKSLKNHPINGTKLYWLLSRCLVEEPKKRSIILI